MKKLKYLIFSAIFFASHMFAQTGLGVKAQSFGGAYRAVASSNDTIFYNPAGLIKLRHLSPSADYMMSSPTKKHRFGASVVDSKTSVWGLGLAYSMGYPSDSDVASDHLAVMSFAMPVISDMISIGTSLSYLNDKNLGAGEYKHFFNMDVGLLISTPIGVGLAVIADHILKPKGGEKPLGLSIGSSFDLGEIMPSAPLTLSFDWSMASVTSDDSLGHEIGAGVEFVALSLLPIRVGFQSSELSDDKYLSLGTGLILGSFALDGLYQQHLSIGRYRHFGLAFSMSM